MGRQQRTKRQRYALWEVDSTEKRIVYIPLWEVDSTKKRIVYIPLWEVDSLPNYQLPIERTMRFLCKPALLRKS